MSLAVDRQKAASLIEFGAIADGGKQIQNLAIIVFSVTDTIGSQHWQLQGACNPDRSLVSPFLFALAMTLQFDIDIVGAEDANQPLYRPAASFFSRVHQCGG